MTGSSNRRPGWRRGFAVAGCVAAVVLVLHVVNAVRLSSPLAEGTRSLLDRARDIRERADAGYQVEALAGLPRHPFNGPFSRLDDLAGAAAMTVSPGPEIDADGGGLVHAFEFDDAEAPGLAPASEGTAWSVRDGILRIGLADGVYLTNDAPIEIPKDDVADIVIRARVSAGTRLRLAWNREADPENVWRYKLDSDLIAGDEFRTYVINGKNALRRGLDTGDRIRRLALLPSNAEDAVVEIDFVRFVSKRAKYRLKPHGTDYETLGKEMRPVLYMLVPQTLQYAVEIPTSSPTLDFGAGVLIDDRPVDFEVLLSQDGGPERVVFTRRLDSSEAWSDARVDLAEWAGRRVNLSLRVLGSHENVALWSSPVVSGDPERRFNVVVVLEDALRADHLSTHGHARPTSPEREVLLGQSGITFLNAISQATMTRPSVPTLMTSLYPTATGVWGFADALSDRYLTLAEILRSQGFVTASFLQNANAGPYAGLHQGFDRLLNAETLGADTQDMYGSRLAAWLERHHRRNFFAYLHVVDPHGKYDPPPPFDAWYRESGPGTTPVKHEGPLDPEWLDSPTAEGRPLLYDGEILHNDSLLPRLLGMLDRFGLRDDTLLVLTSDHGEYLGEHGLWDHHPPGHIQVLDVPLDLVYPRRFATSRRIPQRVQLVDVMPTILELAGVDSTPLLMHGESLIDLIEQRRLDHWNGRVTVSEEPMSLSRDAPAVCGSLFADDWHVIGSPRLEGRFTSRLPSFLRTRVYDLAADPAETRAAWTFVPDLWVKWRYWRIMSRLQADNVTAWRNLTRGDSDALRMDPDVREQLEALGYVQ